MYEVIDGFTVENFENFEDAVAFAKECREDESFSGEVGVYDEDDTLLFYLALNDEGGPYWRGYRPE